MAITETKAISFKNVHSLHQNSLVRVCENGDTGIPILLYSTGFKLILQKIPTHTNLTHGTCTFFAYEYMYHIRTIFISIPLYTLVKVRSP